MVTFWSFFGFISVILIHLGLIVVILGYILVNFGEIVSNIRHFFCYILVFFGFISVILIIFWSNLLIFLWFSIDLSEMNYYFVLLIQAVASLQCWCAICSATATTVRMKRSVSTWRAVPTSSSAPIIRAASRPFGAATAARTALTDPTRRPAPLWYYRLIHP